MAENKLIKGRKSNEVYLSQNLFRKILQINVNKPIMISFFVVVIHLLIGALWLFLPNRLSNLHLLGIGILTSVASTKILIYIITSEGFIYYVSYSLLTKVKFLEKNMMVVHKDQQNLRNNEKKHNVLYLDQLTGLQNKKSLNEKLDKFEKEIRGKRIALLFIDVDNFRYINDTLGHNFGDKLLISISNRLQSFLYNNCIAYRLSGDEFIIFVDDFRDAKDVENLADLIYRGFIPSFDIGSSKLYITVSIGIAVYPDHGFSIDELMKNSDIAVNKAKELGRNKIVIYDKLMNEAVVDRMIIEKYLHKAMENNEFQLNYQPQYDICTNRITGLEALIRWNSSDLGLVTPEKFINVAEATHLIIPIGEWVFRNACLFLKKLHESNYKELTISINISILQLLQDDFVDKIMGILNSVGLDPKYLELELTESILLESIEINRQKLELLRAKGMNIALDDFGKGYSSLSYLKQLPISTLKIDKSFVDMITIDDIDESIVDLIIEIGRRMDLCIIAEGVETQEQLDYLAKHKCNKIQGYLFSKPLSEEEIYNKLECF